jgi:hypothetical protein
MLKPDFIGLDIRFLYFNLKFTQPDRLMDKQVPFVAWIASLPMVDTCLASLSYLN